MKLSTVDPLFKGCTRPAMLIGVPLIPMIVVSMVLFLAGMWTLIFWPIVGVCILTIALPTAIAWMRHVTKKDDFRLEQLIQRFSLSIRQTNQALWNKGVAAYCPITYRKKWR